MSIQATPLCLLIVGHIKGEDSSSEALFALEDAAAKLSEYINLSHSEDGRYGMRSDSRRHKLACLLVAKMDEVRSRIASIERLALVAQPQTEHQND
jgi:hypothetical protein